MDTLISSRVQFDQFIHNILDSNSFTRNHIQNPVSYSITYVFVVGTLLILSYELIYNTGIYLGLWEYHAKAFFPEVPVHCAHLYVKVNFISEDDSEKLISHLEDQSSFWGKKSQNLFYFDAPIKYHIEFGPDDYEADPEFGSNVAHLRKKVLQLVKSSQLDQKYKGSTPSDVRIFNNKSEEVPHSKDSEYLCHVDIETGNAINCVIQI